MSATRRGLLLAAALLGAALGTRADATDEAAPRPAAIGAGVWWLPGTLPARGEPDGNTVIFATTAGLVVLDTGRHDAQRQAILAFARERNQPLVAVINSHWHLDHVSGNPALRAAYPRLRVYASNAIDGALGGFLADSAKDSQRYLDDPQLPEEARADLRADLATIANGAALRPDVVIDRSRTLTLGGRPLQLTLARHAATAGDVWVYDARSGVAALGDLVTLPAPFLDTACPQGWSRALAAVTAAPFRVAIPGHGTPLSPAQVRRYRRAFDGFIRCADSTRPQAECAADWAAAVTPLLGADDRDARRAQDLSAYYVGLLRRPGARNRYCPAPG